MLKYCVLILLGTVAARAQNTADVLTNETVIKMVKAGVPSATIIRTIAAADKVDFRFNQLQQLTDAGVPDDVFKAMAAKDKGLPVAIPPSAPAPAALPPPQSRAGAEPPRSAGPPSRPAVLTNESIAKLAKAGMGEDVIVGIVNSQPGQYSLSADDLIALKQTGVSDKVIGAMLSRNAGAPQQNSISQQSGPEQPDPEPRHVDKSPEGKIRVFVSDSNSWEIAGGFGASYNRRGGSAGGGFAGGARPQTVEVIKTFGERCQEVTITMDRASAQYVVLFDHEGGKGAVRRDNKIAVFRAGGDLLYSGSTRSLGNAVKDACDALLR